MFAKTSLIFHTVVATGLTGLLLSAIMPRSVDRAPVEKLMDASDLTRIVLVGIQIFSIYNLINDMHDNNT